MLSIPHPYALPLPNGYGVAKYTSLNPLIKALRDGIIIRYRILANATKRQNTGLMAGKRIALGFSDTKQWWLERSTNAGLALTVEPTLVSETLPGISSKYNNILLRSWRIDGLASVNDVEKLVATLEVGIGRGRIFIVCLALSSCISGKKDITVRCMSTILRRSRLTSLLRVSILMHVSHNSSLFIISCLA